MSRYPAQLDNDNDLPAVNDNITEIGGEAINALRSSVFELEAALGTDPQGSRNTLSERLAQTLNDDGTFRAAALIASGLVALPITNAQVGASAAIAESKLDLNVPTNSLQNQITSNDIDITELQDALSVDIVNLANHINGFTGRHDGYMIDISGLKDNPGIATVEAALGFIYDSFLLHRAATGGVEHKASAIEYTPQSTGIITATNVQGAIDQIDTDIGEIVRVHNDSAHSDGVSNDGYVLFNGQAAVNDASLRLTRYRSSFGTDLIKVGLINAAVVKSKGFEPSAFNAGASSITITATTGVGLSRSITIPNLHLSQYPSVTSPRFKLKAIVNTLNREFGDTSNNFPATAFELDGEIAIQHNVAREDCTITVSSSGSSAIDAIGFTDVDGVEIPRVDNYLFTVNGIPFTEIRTISTGTIVHGGGASVDLGIDVGQSGLGGDDGYALFHIFNHPTASANGTYRITSVSASPGTSIGLAAPIAAGTFDYKIYDDTFNTGIAGDPTTFDFYIDSNRQLINSLRAAVTTPGITGMKIVEVSQDFEATTATLTFSGSTTRSLVLRIAGIDGIAAQFDPGFVGLVKVFAPNNVSFINVFIFSASATLGTDIISFSSTTDQDDRMLLGTSQYNAGSVLENPLDRRNVGLVAVDSIGSEYTREVVERDLSNFHSSGVIRGFDIQSFTDGYVIVNGGSAYINGRYLERERLTVPAGNLISGSNTYNLLLSRDNRYEIFSNTTAGYDVGDIIAGNQYIIIAQLITTGGVISSTRDGRFFINDIESKMQLSVDERDLGAGAFRTLEAAALYSENAPNDTKPEISVFSDLSVSQDLIIDLETRIISHQNIDITADITIQNNSILEVFGVLTSTGTITLDSGSSLILHGNGNSFTTSATSIDVGDSCSLIINGNTSLIRISITGNNTLIQSDSVKPSITFSGSSDGLTATSVNNLRFKDLDWIMTNNASELAIFALQDVISVEVSSCSFSQSTPLSVARVEELGRAAIEFTGTQNINSVITDGYFTNLGVGIRCQNTLENVIIENSIFHRVGQGINLDNTTNSSIQGCIFDRIHDYGIRNFSTSEQSVISGNIFGNLFNAVSLPVPIRVGGDHSIVSNNTIRNITAENIINTEGESTLVIGNKVYNCITTGYAISMGGFGQSVCSNNIVTDHTGNLFFGEDTSLLGNTMRATGTTSDAVSLEWMVAPTATVIGNRIEAIGGGDFNIFVTDAPLENIITGNQITADRINIDNTDCRLTITGNTLHATSGTQDGVSVTSSTGDYITVISGNIIYGDNGTALRVVGTSIITGNFISADVRGIFHGNNGFASIISNNAINVVGSGTYGIFVDTNNVSITGNFIEGSISSAAIASATGRSSIFIFGNTTGAAGAPGAIMRSESPTPSLVFIGSNKGVTERRAFDASGGYFETPGDWALNALEIENTSGNTTRVQIPLVNLPTTAYIISVEVYVHSQGAAAITADLVKRDPVSFSTGTVLAGTISSTGVVDEILTLTPASPVRIANGELYLVDIESTVIGDQLLQVVANVRI